MNDRIRELSFFLRVSEEASFSAAARSLDLDPSTISKVIQRLENRLGVRLFHRSSRVLRLTQEGEQFLSAAQKVMAALDEAEQSLGRVSAEASGILRLRCIGTRRFRRAAEPRRQSDGLWTCVCDELPEDPPQAPSPALLQTVQALATAIKSLGEQGRSPFDPPYRLDDSGWVANRWCELLPLSLPAKQKLLEIDDPALRLAVVDGLLREQKVVVD